MNLNFLAPDIQENLLFLPPVERGRDPLREHAIRPIAAMFDWRKQRKEWWKFARQVTGPTSGECAALGAAGENILDDEDTAGACRYDGKTFTNFSATASPGK